MTDKEKELQAEAIGYYRKRIAELEMTVGTLRNFSNEQATCIERLEKENAELKKACDETQELLDKQIEATYKLDKENAELKEKVAFLEDNLRVARKDREDLQLDVAKGLKEFVKDYPATSLRYLANEKYVEQLTKAKELLERFLGLGNLWDLDCKDYFPLRKEAEQFLSEVEK